MKRTSKLIILLFTLITGLRVESAGYQGQLEKIGETEEKLMHEKIHRIVSRRLPAKYLSKARQVSQSIMSEYRTHKIDPMMLTAIIAGESNFNPQAIGPFGEIGLMQLKPRTAEWIAKRTGMIWKGEWSLRDPFYNIRLGAAYLGYLKKKYSPQNGFLYLAAYNMGETSLLKLLSNKIQPNIYSNHVMKNYLAINI